MELNSLVKEKQMTTTGGNVNYYLIDVTHPKRNTPYVCEVEDLIESLNMTFAEGTILKSLVRLCKLRQDLGKPHSNPIYEAEKIKYYADRLLEMTKNK
jgi:hypothetical protein